MPEIKLIQGSYSEVVHKIFLPFTRLGQNIDAVFINKSNETFDIEKDIDRLYFCGTESEFQAYLTRVRKECDATYAQGLLSGTVFSKNILDQGFMSRRFDQECLSKKYEAEHSQFAYVDDNGDYCACSLRAVPISEDHKKIGWQAVHIRHTLASPEKREVSILCHPDLLECDDEGIQTDQAKYDAFLAALRSKRVQAKIEPILSQIKPPVRSVVEKPVRAITKRQTRYKLSVLAGIVCLLVAIGCALALSGVLAPIGIVVAGTALMAGLSALMGVFGGLGMVLSGLGLGKWVKHRPSLVDEGALAREMGAERAINFTVEMKPEEGMFGRQLKAKVASTPPPPLAAAAAAFSNDSSDELDSEDSNSPRPK